MNNSLKSNLNTSRTDKSVVDLAAHSLEKQIEDFVSICTDQTTVAYRKEALHNFKQTGFPSTRSEEWRYTDLQSMARSNFSFKSLGFDLACSDKVLNTIQNYIAEMIASQPELSCMVLLDGCYQQSLSVLNTQMTEDGNYLGSINGYNYGQQAQEAGRTNTINAINPISNFVNATWQDGIIIDLAKNKSVSSANIRVLNIVTQISASHFVNVKNICLLGQRQELELTEEYLCFDINDDLIVNPSRLLAQAPGLSSNAVFEIDLAEHSVCKHYLLQNHPQNIYHISVYNITQNKNSEYTNYNINLGAKLSRQDIVVNQNQDYASCNLYGLFLPKAKQHMDTHLKVMHNSSHGTSTQNYIGVLAERGHGVFNGMVYVQQDTVNNNARQSNKNILLSEHAEIDTKPELQIYTDDVVCSHGATIGRLDENSLFYLQSRGIDKKQARNLLITAFINNLSSLIKNKLVVNWIDSKLEAEIAYITENIIC